MRYIYFSKVLLSCLLRYIRPHDYLVYLLASQQRKHDIIVEFFFFFPMKKTIINYNIDLQIETPLTGLDLQNPFE